MMADNVAPDLEQFKLLDLPAYYIPGFITTDEEVYLLRKIETAPKSKWRTLNGRRLQVWGGELTTGQRLIPQAFPPWFQRPDIITRIGKTGVFANTRVGEPNHVIVNEYNPGQGIFAHKDGPAYHPVVATLTLSSYALFHYHAPLSSTPTFSILLEPRSLVITTGELYTEYSHSIDPVEADNLGSVRLCNLERLSGLWREAAEKGETLKRGVRVSLTCRVVDKVTRGLSIGQQ